MSQIKYKRVILKLSGEFFGGGNRKGLNFSAFNRLATYLQKLHKETGVELAVVLGGGNLFRGREVFGTDFNRATADHIGMLGTIMNALALQEELERMGGSVRVMSSLETNAVCEPFILRRAIRHLEKGRIIILAGGTGSPFFTTDSAAALKACELRCELLLKGSNVDGVFTADPNTDTKATMYQKLSYQEALEKGLTVMDNTAFALCQREKIPIVVFNLKDLENIERIICGEKVGTLVA